NDKNVLHFTSSLSFSPNKTFDNTVYSRIRESGNEDNSLLTESSLDDDLSNVALDLEYKHLLDKAGAEVSAKVHYTRFDQNRDQAIFTTFQEFDGPLDENSFFTDADQSINIYTAQLDYITPIGGTSFESGLKASIIDSESRIDYMGAYPDIEEGALQWDEFLYDEKIYAGYVSIAKDWSKWSAKAGLRGEYTDRTGDSRSMEQIDDREYFELFPTFYLQHNFNENHSLTF
ncbi:outer membrane beta-barrel family protein, partial [Salinimicrobium oceani]